MVEISNEHLSAIITQSVVLQLTPEVREGIITKAVKDYLLTPENRYDTTTRLHNKVNGAIDREVQRLVEDLLTKDPYKSTLNEAVNKELTKVLDSTEAELSEKLSNLVGSAVLVAIDRKTRR